MEGGVAAAGRSSFRKPSHSTAQRNYRRRSPSSASKSEPSTQSASRSRSPAPKAPAAGWKRDRSVSSSPANGSAAAGSELASKKGKTGHRGNDDDEDRDDKIIDPGPGSSERHTQGRPYYRSHGNRDYYDSRRSSGSYYDRSFGRGYGRDFHGDGRRSGDHEFPSHSRFSPERGSRDNFRGRDRDRRRDREGRPKYRADDRELYESDSEGDRARRRERSRERGRDRDRGRDRERDRDRDRGRDRDRDRDWERDRERDRDRGRDRGRDRYRDRGGDRGDRYRDRSRPRRSSDGQDGEADRRHEGRRGSSGPKDEDRDEGLGARRLVKEQSVDEDIQRVEEDEGRDGGTEKSRDWESGTGVGKEVESNSSSADAGNSNHLEGEHSKRSEKEKYKAKGEASELSVDLEIDTRRTELEGSGDDDDEYKGTARVEGRGSRDVSGTEVDKDADSVRDKVGGSPGDGDDSDDHASPGRHRARNGRGDGRSHESEERYEESRLRDQDGGREASAPRAKEDGSERDWDGEREVMVSEQGHHKASNHPYNGRSGSKSTGNSQWEGPVKNRDKGNVKGSGRDGRLGEGMKDRGDPAVSSDNQDGTRGSELSFNSESKDRKPSRDRKFAKGDQESALNVRNLPTNAGESETKSTGGSDVKLGKGSKWGPQTSDCSVKPSGTEEIANDFNAAKLAAMKAAELVNKNLGASGFMSADQKKRLLWGSKKSPSEQEPTVATGSNRWDTVHFADPDRQEKFHKLMGVKGDAGAEVKKEADTDSGLFTEERQRELQHDLEKQFAAGLRRRDGGKVGLGL